MNDSEADIVGENVKQKVSHELCSPKDKNQIMLWYNII